jgi:hypothetical protein
MGFLAPCSPLLHHRPSPHPPTGSNGRRYQLAASDNVSAKAVDCVGAGAISTDRCWHALIGWPCPVSDTSASRYTSPFFDYLNSKKLK